MQTLRITFLSISSLLLWVTVATAASEEIRSTLDDQQEVAVTIYNDDLALVRDQRLIKINAGENHLALRDVAARIRPETALLHNLDHPHGLTLLEQNFDYDLLSPEKLLEKYVGRGVRVLHIDPQNNQERSENAVILSANGPVLLIGDRIESGAPGRIVFSELPAELRDRPTLVTTFTSRETANDRLELTYLTGGLSWQADYVALLTEEEDRLDLSAWVTLNNQSGTTYRNARLQLVAGEVNRVQAAVPMLMKSMMARGVADQEEGIREEGLFEYHLYTLDRPTTIRENQSKQLALLSANGVGVVKAYELRGEEYLFMARQPDIDKKLKIAAWLTFSNREENRLGLPLPQGIVRVYKKDAAGHPQFVGEDKIEHTAKNESVRLLLGNSFDLTAERSQTDYKKLATNERDRLAAEIAFRIVLRNAKAERVTVQIIEPIPGEWEILSESSPHRPDTGQSAIWTVSIPAEGEATLIYRVRVHY